MNMCVITGVLINEVIPVKIKDKQTLYFFQIGTSDDTTGDPVYINCFATLDVGKSIYEAKEGTPFTIRGGLVVLKNKMYLKATFVEWLMKRNKVVQMNLKDFLEVYEPSKVMYEYRKLCKKQEQEETKSLEAKE